MKDWLSGNMGAVGEFQYQALHLWSTAVVLIVLAAVLCFGASKRLSSNVKQRLLKGICWFQLGFELLWRLVYVLVNGSHISCWWPLYPCNLGGILIPIIALADWKPGKKLFYLFGFVGGVITFAIPEGIFCRDVLSFPILKSILQHTGLLLIPGLEFAAGRWRPTVKDLGWVIAGGLVHILNSEGITRLLGFTGDYMYFRSGLPFVISGVPQFITLTGFALLVLTVLSVLADLTAKKRTA